MGVWWPWPSWLPWLPWNPWLAIRHLRGRGGHTNPSTGRVRSSVPPNNPARADLALSWRWVAVGDLQCQLSQLVGFLRGNPLLNHGMIIIPKIWRVLKGSRIPTNHQPTEVLNTAQLPDCQSLKKHQCAINQPFLMVYTTHKNGMLRGGLLLLYPDYQNNSQAWAGHAPSSAWNFFGFFGSAVGSWVEATRFDTR